MLMSVTRYVGQLVDQMVSADYLKSDKFLHLARYTFSIDDINILFFIYPVSNLIVHLIKWYQDRLGFILSLGDVVCIIFVSLYSYASLSNFDLAVHCLHCELTKY